MTETQSQPMVCATVTTNASVLFPEGSKMSVDQPNTVVTLNGDTFKFWTVVELVATDNDPEVCQNLDYQQMQQLGLSMEHDETLVDLCDTEVAFAVIPAAE